MKKRICFAIFACLLLSGPGFLGGCAYSSYALARVKGLPAPSPDGKLINGDFEAGESFEEGWFYDYSNIEGGEGVSPVVTQGTNGNQSLSIDVPGEKPADFYNLVQRVGGLRAGQTLRLSGDIRTTDQRDGVGGAMISLALEDPERPGERQFANDSERIKGTTDWETVSTTIFVPEGFTTAQIWILIHGHGRADFDNLKLDVLDEQPAVAGNSVKVDVTGTITTPDFIGFGVEDDCFYFTEENLQHLDESDIALREERIAEMDPSVIATLFWWDAINPSHDLQTLTWDSPLMEALVRTLQVHEEAGGRQVFFGDVFWGWAPEDFPYSDANVERGVEIYADVIEYLVKEKGLTCIKNVSISGEVDMVFESMGGSFDSYIKAVRLLRETLHARGLTDIRVMGDKSGGFLWFRDAVELCEDSMDIFTIHEYPDTNQFPLIDNRIDTARTIIETYSPINHNAHGQAWHKPIFLYEIGYFDRGAGDTDNNQSASKKFSYGQLCAYTCISALNRGIVGGSVWCLHAMYYPGNNLMDFGFWEWKQKDWSIRPNYYGYGLFSRFALPGLLPVRVEVAGRPYDFNAGALRDAEGKHIVYLNNLTGKALTVDLNGLPGDDYEIYEYAADRLPTMDGADYGQLDALKTGELWQPSDGTLEMRADTLVMLKAVE